MAELARPWPFPMYAGADRVGNAQPISLIKQHDPPAVPKFKTEMKADKSAYDLFLILFDFASRAYAFETNTLTMPPARLTTAKLQGLWKALSADAPTKPPSTHRNVQAAKKILQLYNFMMGGFSHLFGLNRAAVPPYGFQHTPEFRYFCATVDIHKGMRRARARSVDDATQASKLPSLSWNNYFRRNDDGVDVNFVTPNFRIMLRDLGDPTGLGPGIGQPELTDADAKNLLRNMPEKLYLL